MELKKREVFLIAVTVVLVIVLGIGFYYDRSSALIDRTNLIKFSQDPNLKLEKINKAGFLFSRQYYEAKFKIQDQQWDKYFDVISNAYGGGGGVTNIDGYKAFEESVLQKASLKANPKSDGVIWILGSTLGSDTTMNVVYVIAEEVDGNPYLYIYYSRK